MSDELLSFKTMCARFDVTPRTLRYYEYIELIAPVKQGRTRLYGPRDVVRMGLILRGRRYGFSLEEIRQWLQIYSEKGSYEQNQVLIEKANRQLEVLEKQYAELFDTIVELRALRDETIAAQRQ